MAWIALLFAGLFEIVWATAMKQSDGFTRPLPTILMVVAMLFSFGLLAWSLKVLPLGTAYTIWTGIGAVGAFIIGIAWFGEALSLMRVTAAVLIVCGLVMMKLSSPA
ncbi:hypothetical protein PK98_14100 [Croceibacterium mercuriale]|uniref:Guanidinium exporter n=1 Tax=Croceibacterium mercuriale TaxID=1572751 RepID=A0A0B2BZR6_9SPHN|nr:multidrug efflux SMR transporter [Croceibacterium mercuriale]KHL25176.1 hypothetical protein PK98_14100 [Croceibacterium mercuriale]